MCVRVEKLRDKGSRRIGKVQRTPIGDPRGGYTLDKGQLDKLTGTKSILVHAVAAVATFPVATVGRI